MGELYNGNLRSLESAEVPFQKMFQTEHTIIGEDYYIVLFTDGIVWSRGNNSTGKLGINESTIPKPQKITELENIAEIVDGGDTVYALEEGGNVYFWGRKPEYLFKEANDDNSILWKPEKLEGLTGIVDIDAKNNRMFALDDKGSLYSLGMYLDDYKRPLSTVFSGQYEKLGENIASIAAGAGNYHYFIRTDGTIFSLMEYSYDGSGAPYAFIFPEEDDASRIEQIYYKPEELGNITILSQNSKEGYTVYYDLSGVDGVDKVSSDNYTMFISKTDGTLWFWDSDRIKYHDNVLALADPEDGTENCAGKFVEADIRNILEINDDSSRMPCITDMQSGMENTIFLTDDGSVFYSRYETYSIKIGEGVCTYTKINGPEKFFEEIKET